MINDPRNDPGIMSPIPLSEKYLPNYKRPEIPRPSWSKDDHNMSHCWVYSENYNYDIRDCSFCQKSETYGPGGWSDSK